MYRRVYVYVYVNNMYMAMSICTHVYIYIHHACMHACMHTYIPTYIHTYIHVGTCKGSVGFDWCTLLRGTTQHLLSGGAVPGWARLENSSQLLSMYLDREDMYMILNKNFSGPKHAYNREPYVYLVLAPHSFTLIAARVEVTVHD